ncbi:hypothetical protein O181_008310 [Austropuccinia psidii MF-1]|uniref:Uncharacterized protein n=1 Tax=Austropuccinia psidii MF-1 TaxID=1389203 RepID=A0A9Q3GIS1_9BASI|nr:hypothetical protein [Austropuccinia psidii MF-1]
MFKKLGVPLHQSSTILEQLSMECANLFSQRNVEHQGNVSRSSSQGLGENKSFDLLKHVNQTPIKMSYEALESHKYEVVAYLQTLHPMAKGEPIIDYWKASHDQIQDRFLVKTHLFCHY